MRSQCRWLLGGVLLSGSGVATAAAQTSQAYVDVADQSNHECYVPGTVQVGKSTLSCSQVVLGSQSQPRLGIGSAYANADPLSLRADASVSLLKTGTGLVAASAVLTNATNSIKFDGNVPGAMLIFHFATPRSQSIGSATRENRNNATAYTEFFLGAATGSAVHRHTTNGDTTFDTTTPGLVVNSGSINAVMPMSNYGLCGSPVPAGCNYSDTYPYTFHADAQVGMGGEFPSVDMPVGAAVSGDISVIVTGIDLVTSTGTLINTAAFAPNGQGFISVNPMPEAVRCKIEVRNCRPVPTIVSASGTNVIVTGQQFVANISATDANVGDGPWRLNIDWGDGTSFNSTLFALPTDLRPFARGKVWPASGTYAVRVTVTDKNGGQGSQSMNVTVIP